MRFMFGLLIGALATLLVATAFDAPVGGVQQSILSAWEQVKSLAAQRDQTAVESTVDEGSQAFAYDDESEANEAMILPESEVNDEPTMTVAPIPAEPSGVMEDETYEPPLLTQNDPQPETMAEPIQETGQPEPALMLEEPDVTAIDFVSDVTDSASATGGEGVVWSPFHSEASAQGFARRLSSQLNYQFDVRKQGPAQYLVVYDYASELERVTIEDQIALATGQQ